jgi:hypothetical protein
MIEGRIENAWIEFAGLTEIAGKKKYGEQQDNLFTYL